MSYKETTRESYEATAEAFACNVAELAPRESIVRFSKLLPPKAKIIDIGSGSGRDAKIFSDLGVDVVGIDFCSNLIQHARKHATLAEFHVMDIEAISFPPASFDGAWAGCSLIHIPKKNIVNVLNKIHFILKDKGYFYLTIKKGTGEGLENDIRYGNCKKFWSYFEEDELKLILEQSNFKILELCTVEKRFAYQTHHCLRAFCQKNNKS
jgi:ubiquinone/menaquinone biosynthesis C-methylase UbiE